RGEFWNGGARPITSPATVNDDRWHHVCLVLDGSAKLQTLYLDGKPLGTLPGAVNHVNMQHNQIGVGCTGGWPGGNGSWYGFVGNIAEVRVWHAVRTQAEIQENMGRMLSGWEPGLVAYYPLDEATGDLAIDRSRHHRNAKLGGGVAAQQPSRALIEPFLQFEAAKVNNPAGKTGTSK